MDVAGHRGPDLGRGGPGARLVPALPRLVVDWLAADADAAARRVDGTMVFVDISGFTALSERLAKRGKAGAEELTEILDGLFAQLLLRAWDLGGGLVKFGGDALLLLFSGDAHPQRACAAAYDLRQQLADSGNLETSAGPVALQMSVGVHTGAFDFFLVGGSHRELLLTGPAASRTVEAEGTAEAGQILVSTDTAACLDPGLLGAAIGPGRLLEGRPEAEPRPPQQAAPLPTVLLESCIPLALRRVLWADRSEPEHRIVTVAFLHFMGVDQLLAEHGADRVAADLSALVSEVQRHIDPHRVCFLGSDVYGDGGKLIFVAGAPEAAGGDEERMLRGLRGIFDADLPLAVRAGVNRGHVYAGEVGPPIRRTYTVMGDAVNLAARLMQAAKPGEILATEGVLRRSRTVFAVQALEPFFVKGKAKAVQAYRLGEVTGTRRADPEAGLPLVGRDAELDRLRAVVGAVAQGQGQVLAVRGSAGVGKTRLLEDLRQHDGDAARFTLLCEQYEEATPYWAVRWLLRRLLGIPAPASPADAGRMLAAAVGERLPHLVPWLPLLAAPVDAEVGHTAAVDRLDPAYRRERLERVTVDLVLALLPAPALLVLEDVQWLDEASRSLLRRLCDEVVDRPVGVLLAGRELHPDLLPPDRSHVDVLELGPLPPEAAEQLAVAATEQSPRPLHELRAIVERSGGSPLFLLQLLAGGRRGDAATLPDTIEAAITAHIDELEPNDRIVLRCAAVLGMSFPMELARDALRPVAPDVDGPEVWSRLDEFLSAEVDGRRRFRQALYREVAYEGLPYRRRRTIHASVAQRLEADPDLQAESRIELLALHFQRAERYAKAWHYARLAGGRAREKAATVEAAGFYRQALDAAAGTTEVPDHEVAAVAEELGDVCELGGLYDEGARAYRLARRIVGADPHRVAELLRKEGLLQQWAGRYRHARLLYRSGRRQLAAAGAAAGADLARQRIRAGLEVVTAASLVLEGRYRAGIWWARRALQHADDADVLKVVAHACYLLDWAYTDLGDTAAATEFRERGLPIYEQLGDLDGLAKALNNLGADAYYEGRWAEALEHYERSREALEEVGNVVEAATVTSNIAEVLLQQGHLERADALFGHVLGVMRGAGSQIGAAWALCNLGQIAARRGDVARARATLTDARDAFRAIGAERYALEATVRLAEVSVLEGDHQTATALLDRARAESQERGGLPFLEAPIARLLGYAMLQAGDHHGAREALAEALAAARGTDAAYEVALTLEAQGRLEEVTGGGDGQAARRSRALLDELGVVATADVPLPPAEGAGKALLPGLAGR